MRIFQNRRGVVLCMFIAQLSLFFPQRSLGQVETFDIVHFTPPRDWKKNAIEGAITYTNANKSAGTFCVLTIYSSTPSVGTAQADFANEWNQFVVKPYKTDANPKTEIQTRADGWKIIAGGASVELDGIKFLVVLTVFSGFGKKVSVMANLNDQSYLAGIGTLLDDIKFERPPAASAPPSRVPGNRSSGASPETPGAAAIEWYIVLRDYQQNEIAADGTYLGKRIRVSGPFEHAEMEQGRIVVWFNTPAFSFSHFGCYFPASQRPAVGALKPGQQIVVEGICRGRMSIGRVMMEECVLR